LKKARTTYIHNQVLVAIAACRDAADLKIVIAPENHAALSLRTALARQGTPLINIEAVTPSGLARHIWRAVFPQDGYRLLNRTAAEYVLGVLVEELDESVADLLRSSISTVYDSIRSDREAALTPEYAHEIAKNPVQVAYANLYGRYVGFLSETGRLDEIDIQRLASQAVEQFAAQRHVGLVVMSDMVELSDAELSLISDLGRLSGQHFLFGSSLRKGAHLPDWAYSVPFEEKEKVEKARTLIRSTRREEVRSVLADILDQGVSFDEVEIALTDENMYLGEVAAACERFGIPWQTSARSSDMDPRLLALVRSYAEWVISGHAIEGLTRMIRNRLLDVSQMEEQTGDIASALDAFPVGIAKLKDPEVRSVMAQKAGSRGVSRSQLVALHTFIDKVS